MAPGLGIHLVLSELTVYPDLHTTFAGSHCVPDLSIWYPNGHCNPSRTHLVESLRSTTKPLGHVVTQVKFANKYPDVVAHLSQ